MTQEELDAAIAEIIIAQEKPRSTQNSHRRKQWENCRNWRLCTIGESCKFGSLKDYEEREKFYDQFQHIIRGVFAYSNGKLAHIFYDSKRHHFKLGSINKKWLRRIAERAVRLYKGDISNGSMYQKIFDYAWNCD